MLKVGEVSKRARRAGGIIDLPLLLIIINFLFPDKAYKEIMTFVPPARPKPTTHPGLAQYNTKDITTATMQ